jgi:hypothetical protein
MTANTERGGHGSQGRRRGPAICGALADPNDQRAIVGPPDTGTG